MRTEVDEEHIKIGLLGNEQAQAEAIRDAYERYKRPLFGFIRESVAPTLDSDEIVSAIHDVFCGLAKYVSRGKFTPTGSLKTLLFTMARRKGYDQLRRKTKNQPVIEAQILEDGSIECSDGEEEEEEEFAKEVGKKLAASPEISAIWKNAADDASTNEILRQFKIWIATAKLPRLQRKVAEFVALYVGDISDSEICDEISKTGERPTVASVKSARKEIIRKFGTLMQRQERKTSHDSR